MSRFWHSIDLLLRRNPLLPRCAPVRNLLRRPYHWMMSLGGGLPLNIGGVLPVRLPARYLAREQEFYEAENYRALKSWIDDHEDCAIVDIGCSFGYFSCAALFQPAVSQVLAIDADRESLGITNAVCQYAPRVEHRLILVNCLISSRPEGTADVESLRRATKHLFSSGTLSGRAENAQYVNADTAITADLLPRVPLDQLVPACIGANCPLLIKVDVEGAELIVLQGAVELLSQRRPTLLLSVHPGFLPRFGASTDDVVALLRKHGYAWTVLSIDHEEHWLCTPGTAE